MEGFQTLAVLGTSEIRPSGRSGGLTANWTPFRGVDVRNRKWSFNLTKNENRRIEGTGRRANSSGRMVEITG